MAEEVVIWYIQERTKLSITRWWNLLPFEMQKWLTTRSYFTSRTINQQRLAEETDHTPSKLTLETFYALRTVFARGKEKRIFRNRKGDECGHEEPSRAGEYYSVKWNLFDDTSHRINSPISQKNIPTNNISNLVKNWEHLDALVWNKATQKRTI